MKSIVYILVFLVVVSIVSAVDVGVVVEFEDSSLATKCVTVDEGTDGRVILEKTGLDLLWSPTTAYGSLICKINGEGTDISGDYCEYSGKFWNFNILMDDTWEHMPVGNDAPGGCWNRDLSSWSGHYCGIDGDVIGYKFTDSGAPPLIKFDEICPETRIAISDLKVKVDGKERNLNDGGTIKNAKPGSEIEFKIELENLNKKNGLDINEVNAEITIEDIDDDLTEETDSFDLNSGTKKTKTLKFNIPLEVDEDSYDVIIQARGEQEDGTDFSLEWLLDLEVDKDKHSVVIEKAGLDEDILECGESTSLNLRLMNLGSDDESTILRIENKDLGISIKEDLVLKEGPYSSSYTIPTTEGLESGIYPIAITALYSEELEKETANLNVECTKEETQQQPIAKEQKKQEQTTKLTGQAVNAPVVNKKGLAIALIAIGELAFAAILIFVLIKVLKH